MNTHGRVGPPTCTFDPDRLTLTLDMLIASRIEEISPAVSKIMTFIKKDICAPEHNFAVETALQEALANAVLHGNHLDPDKMVRICCACQKDRGVIIVVKDEGEGFDATKVPGTLVGEHIYYEHGRGIYLISALMDEVRFVQGGREIYMRKGGSATC